MEYLNYALLESIDPAAYQRTLPFPWIGLEGALTDEGYRALLASLPPLEIFDKDFGYQRKHGQQSHDRFSLEWTPEREAGLPKPWVELIHECLGDRYREIVCGLYEAAACEFRFHWHYTPSGCSVSPHCDSPKKLGSHIFYFNTQEDWDPAWGGETVILDDGGRWSPRSAPGFADFERTIRAQSLGNRSLIFSRKPHAWHGVEEIRCPEGRLRKVFIAVINKAKPGTRFLRLLHRAVAG
jgi:hypothetical protein